MFCFTGSGAECFIMQFLKKICLITSIITPIYSGTVDAQNLSEADLKSTYPTIKIVSQEIPKAYWKDGSGDYNQILNYLIHGYPGDIEISFLPSSRAMKTFDTKNADCSFVDLAGNHQEATEFLGPTNTITVTAYTRAELPDIRSPADMRNIDFAIDVNLRETANEHNLKATMSLQSQEQMIDLLVKGRIDAMIGFDYDLDLLVKELNYEDKLKKASVIFSEEQDGMLCHANPKTKLFRDIVRKNLQKAIETGFLDKVFDQ